jgi:hypothetical protein
MSDSNEFEDPAGSATVPRVAPPTWPDRHGAAEHLGISFATVRRREASGELQAVYDARGVVRFDPEQLGMSPARTAEESMSDEPGQQERRPGPPAPAAFGGQSREGVRLARGFQALQRGATEVDLVLLLQEPRGVVHGVMRDYAAASKSLVLTAEERVELERLCSRHTGRSLSVSTAKELHKWFGLALKYGADGLVAKREHEQAQQDHDALRERAEEIEQELAALRRAHAELQKRLELVGNGRDIADEKAHALNEKLDEAETLTALISEQRDAALSELQEAREALAEARRDELD